MESRFFYFLAACALVVYLAMTGTKADFNKCMYQWTSENGKVNQCTSGNAEEWRPVLKKAYLQQKHMPPPKSISQKRVLEEELPKPYRILTPFSPYTRYRTHRRLTIYVDDKNIVEDVECS
ncbi:hypothetical protein GGF40_002900 [Coemansia sp. RSA 1286]|nr:hypothetical protein IWW45_001174 [Coemansia sp. RSA 485]KAJ2636611.1 hypothetical protein GGF40_002900 [Coemansia sp. RSA 1286]